MVLVYGGDSDFPPYEYLDAEGRSRGFNIDLVRALSRQLRVRIDVRLGRWSDIVRRLDAGEFDLVSLAYSEARARRYAFVGQTWTLTQALLFKPGRAEYPRFLDALAGEIAAVEHASLMGELLTALPEARRPVLLEVPSQRDALTALAEGRATVAAGNELTLRHVAHERGFREFAAVRVKSLSYSLATRRGSRVDRAVVAAALQALRKNGELDRLVETHLTRPAPVERLTLKEIAVAFGLVLLAAGLGIGWNWSLRRQVRRQTEALRRSLASVEASVRERDGALAALRASEARHRSLIDNMISGLITVDSRGKIELVNPAAARIFGYAPHELMGQPLTRLVPIDDDAKASQFLRSAASKALGRITRWEGRRKTGALFPFELSLFEFDGAGGRSLAGTLLDISERRQVERMKDEFVSVVSHELRTPLTAMKASMQLLLDDAEARAGEEGRQLLSVALGNTDRLIRIVNDLLDVAKIEAGRLELRLGRTSPQALVDQALANVEPLADTLAVRLARVVEAGLPDVALDQDRIVQVLVNLLSNALKFAPRASTVSVGASRIGQGEVRFWVQDEGRGISKEQLAKLFHKFQQLDSSDTRSVQGTGLGLAIAKAIVDQHRGRIGVTTSPGQGTTFYFDLPIDQAGADASSQTAA